ncbi:hypothetical protein DAMNIGENAA_31060 [Desulforhabdus amnigena]|uniref:Uncharacterized protein n=1 Tax=Desulforhabdus amnigena TaxID=40218 RepID=A0A9W6FVM3_9BACT|nr:hypothetical protein DAMNIGENAA_31060 [Desulforhabdus amnigena]
MSACESQSIQMSLARGKRPVGERCFSLVLRKPGQRPQRFLGCAAGSLRILSSHMRFSSRDNALLE